jgi:malonyl-CoA O-methyltransferase
MAYRLAGLLQDHVGNTDLQSLLELGCGTGLLTELLVDRFVILRLILNDLIPDLTDLSERCRLRQRGMIIDACVGDMERIELPSGQDVVVSNAVLQWAADPLAMLDRMVGAVRPGGVIGIATFGPRNVHETVDLTGRSLAYLSVEEICRQLEPRAEILACQEQFATISFASAYAVLRHLKQTGVNGLDHKVWSRRSLREFCEAYESRHRVGDHVPLTYHPIVMVARRHGALRETAR